ncbi:MAG TPA: tetratricopeptide repeat protein [Terriglobia bacterium]|nr:tetratricopeptide repeat protein [Terriglobia bacterium]
MKGSRFPTVAWALLAPALIFAASDQPLPPLPELRLTGSFATVSRQIRDAEAVVRAHPRNPAANGKLAMVLDTYEQFAAAGVCYRRANLLDPKSFDWLYDLGWVEFKQGHYEEAAKALAGSLRLRPDYLPAELKLADSWLAAAQFESAGKLYEQTIQQQPDSAEAHYGLGRVEAAGGDLKAAAAALEKACDLFPRYGMAHYALARVFQKLGEAKEAEAQFTLYRANVTTVPPAADPLRAAVEQLDQSPQALVRRGITLAQTGDLQGAIREHLKVLAIDPNDVQAHINLIQLYAQAGEVERAEYEYQAAVRLNPNRADCYYNYGVMMFHLQRNSEAEMAFRQAIEINPYHAEAHNNLGVLLEMQGKVDAALAEFEQAVRDQPDYRLAHFQLGRILVNQEKYPQAIEEFQKSLTPDDENTPSYLYALGATYARAGDRQNALRYMREARDRASARGQSALLASIDKDLESLEGQANPH